MQQLKTRYRVEGMDCPSCAAKIETAARRVDGVLEVSVTVANGSSNAANAAMAETCVRMRCLPSRQSSWPLIASIPHAHERLSETSGVSSLEQGMADQPRASSRR